MDSGASQATFGISHHCMPPCHALSPKRRGLPPEAYRPSMWADFTAHLAGRVDADRWAGAFAPAHLSAFLLIL
jgi:hypothetical protein